MESLGVWIEDLLNLLLKDFFDLTRWLGFVRLIWAWPRISVRLNLAQDCVILLLILAYRTLIHVVQEREIRDVEHCLQLPCQLVDLDSLHSFDSVWSFCEHVVIWLTVLRCCTLWDARSLDRYLPESLLIVGILATEIGPFLYGSDLFGLKKRCLVS